MKSEVMDYQIWSKLENVLRQKPKPMIWLRAMSYLCMKRHSMKKKSDEW